MTPEELAEQMYPTKLFPSSHARRAFVFGWHQRHQWQKVGEDFQGDPDQRYFITDGKNIAVAEQLFGGGWIADVETDHFGPITHVLPYFFPELPNDQNTNH